MLHNEDMCAFDKIVKYWYITNYGNMPLGMFFAVEIKK